MEKIIQALNDVRFRLDIPRINLGDIIQIIILAFIIYHAIVFLKNTQAWTLFKGIIVLVVVSIIIKLLNFNVLFWLISHSFTVLIFTAIVVFQPELRSALDKIGRKKFAKVIFSKADDINDLYDENSIDEIVSACFEMGQNKTGAIIAIQKEVPLDEFSKTGIMVDAKISRQLILNTFEHNTPLHDGAMVIKDNRIVACTCYFPLSKSRDINKKLGTRHRAAIGITELTDSICIVVSEETGKVSVALSGVLNEEITSENLKTMLNNQRKIQQLSTENDWIKILKGFLKREKSAKK